MLHATLALLGHGRSVARGSVARAWRHWRNRDCWHPELDYHPSPRWIFRCARCGRPLNIRPMGASVRE